MANQLTDRRFIHFNKLENFENQLKNYPGSILDTQIVFIKDARKIWTHGTFYTLDERITDDIYSKIQALAEISMETIQRLSEAQFIVAGSSEDRPDDAAEGTCYLDVDLQRPIWWDGEKWIDSNGNNVDIPHQGILDSRPDAGDVKIGFEYLDTTANVLYISNGNEWVRLTDNNTSWTTIDENGNITEVQNVTDNVAWSEIN